MYIYVYIYFVGMCELDWILMCLIPIYVFVIFLWMKYMLHALLDIFGLYKMWYAQESVMSAY